MAAYMKKLDDFLEEKNPLTEQMGKLEQTTGMKKKHQAFGTLGAATLLSARLSCFLSVFSGLVFLLPPCVFHCTLPAFGGIILLWFIFGFGASLLCSVIGFIYPAYRS